MFTTELTFWSSSSSSADCSIVTRIRPSFCASTIGVFFRSPSSTCCRNGLHLHRAPVPLFSGCAVTCTVCSYSCDNTCRVWSNIWGSGTRPRFRFRPFPCVDLDSMSLCRYYRLSALTWGRFDFCCFDWMVWIHQSVRYPKIYPSLCLHASYTGQVRDRKDMRVCSGISGDSDTLERDATGTVCVLKA